VKITLNNVLEVFLLDKIDLYFIQVFCSIPNDFLSFKMLANKVKKFNFEKKVNMLDFKKSKTNLLCLGILLLKYIF